jgi:hypothetical protein
VELNNSTAVFESFGLKCAAHAAARNGTWWAPDQPSYVSGSSDPNFGECLGYVGNPPLSACGASYPSASRICRCGAPIEPSSAKTFGTGHAGVTFPSAEEMVVFQHKVKAAGASQYAAMTHFWSTSSAAAEAGLVVRYYVDGEANASIAFNPPLAVGVGFDESLAPWGTKWFGLGAGGGGKGQAWFHNLCVARPAPLSPFASLLPRAHPSPSHLSRSKIPFQESIRVTVQAATAPASGSYIILRGGLFDAAAGSPLTIGDVQLPPTCVALPFFVLLRSCTPPPARPCTLTPPRTFARTCARSRHHRARLQLQTYAGPLEPLEVLDVARVPAGYSGQLFMSTIAVNNSGVGGLNFLEGCFHFYDPPTQPFPGTLLATGTEDYYDSGWYFNAGTFHMPVSGFTHIKKEPNVTEWSAYRFHEMDPLRFSDGLRFTWRCGDMVSPEPGVGKCYTESGGNVVGSPTCDWVQTYAWVYVWPNSAEREL